jgi:hypothetical protein
LDRFAGLIDDVPEMDLDDFRMGQNDLGLLLRKQGKNAIRGVLVRGSRHRSVSPLSVQVME